ncbi:alpha-ketoglutarate-dependent dioxygenase AlkB family protein [Myroides sp. LoEW2-1]|uniref:alpha-ketoglutarate-dependent dioxygenase AlkB family protein n=1 Tax=Myroides sp. LoEW2-1 TaxID=2683192 RepID=UPI001327122B|nr:alpha-ketoglutarate-dependent dioxygenase AlkB [Myroides sp. LoEW2-1]MVX36713.1 alpha-ketoglutarate-dependent dioxygenase AlkB [Myroides sp. LoEW2-1]
MDLFTQFVDEERDNLLPFDGEVLLHGFALTVEESLYYYSRLLDEIAWKHDEAVVNGKRISTKRKIAWYGDERFAYTYSNVTKYALPWTESLLVLKTIVEAKTGETYNSCLLNYYATGEEGMAWHSDGEIDLKKNGSIASLSFGATRIFSFKHKELNQKRDVVLETGSLIEMKGVTQDYWLHRLPPSKKVRKGRINLTFRTIEKES